MSSPVYSDKQRSLLNRYLACEWSTTSMLNVLAAFGILQINGRPFRTPPKEIWISHRDIKAFATRWVKRDHVE